MPATVHASNEFSFTLDRRKLLSYLGLATVAGALGGVLTGDTPSLAGALQTASAAPTRSVIARTSDQQEWATFRQRFITVDGRVVDTGNNACSHTEGQGYGMLMAVSFDDRATFDRILNWTCTMLARPTDNLFSWRYQPQLATPVPDHNNATDGDLMIAWALWKAAQRWNDESYATRAQLIARDILDLLVLRVGNRTVLLPGADGYVRADRIDVNPSYYVFPAFLALAEAVPSDRWGELVEHGVHMIEQGRFGRWRLPPDWLSVARDDGKLTLASTQSRCFSYDAIRVPLYLAWGRQPARAIQEAFVAYTTMAGATMPAWTDLSDDSVAGYQAPTGMAAVALISSATLSGSGSAGELPSVADAGDYYSAALTMLSRLAARDIGIDVRNA